MLKIAAIDTGSNAIRLVVATLAEDGRIEPLENIRIPIRLGQDTFADQILKETTIQSTVDTFIQFRRIIDDLGVFRLKAVATSAVREANNRQILIDRIEHSAGIQLEVITGEEEARLVCLAVDSALDIRGKRVIMVDIGGGSVEITVTRGSEIEDTNSFRLGTVRLLQALHGEKEKRSSLEYTLLMKETIEAIRRPMETAIGSQRIDLCVGTGGNVEEIGQLCRRLKISNSEQMITPGELHKLSDLISPMSDQERIKKMELRPDRADVILPAILVLDQIVRLSKVNDIRIPSVGLKNGVLIDLAEEMQRHGHVIDDQQVRESAIRIGKKYQFDLDHGLFVARSAVSLFGQTQSLHQLSTEDCLILEVGALLHDIGHFINTVDHDQHGAYILEVNHLIGLSDTQQKMVSALVRYHRKGYPYREDSGYKELSAKNHITLSKLCALLRLADAMDSSHTQKVKNFTISHQNSTWRLSLQSQEDLTLEKWNIMKRGELFREVFGQSLEMSH